MGAAVESWLVDDLRGDARAAPHAISLKLDKLSRDAFSFFRGTLTEYVRQLQAELRGPLAAPQGLITGDLHLENFGTYLDERAQVSFDFNDFDEVTRAPLCIDLRRLAASAALVAGGEAGARAVLDGLRRGAALPLDAPLELPATVRALMRRSACAERRAFLAEATHRQGGAHKLTLGPMLHPPPRALSRALDASLARLSPRSSVLDAAHRLAGNGSLGRRRYLALVAGLDRSPVILDLKEPRPSPWGAVSRLLGERQRARQVERAARALRLTSEKILGTARLHGRLFQLREHSPHGMKLKVAELTPAERLTYAGFTGALLARGWRRAGAPVHGLVAALDGGGERTLVAWACADAARIDSQFERFLKHRARIARHLALQP